MNETSFFFLFLVAWIALALVSCTALLFTTAPYGKFTRAGWGPSLDRRVGWVLMELPAAAGLLLFYAWSDRRDDAVALVFLTLWQIHYVYRTFIFPFLMRGDAKQMTLVTATLGMLFNVGNAYLNGYYLFHLSEGRSPAWLADPRFIIGAGLFAFGLYVNASSDRRLRALRQPGETGYKIPRGGLFDKVSSANYLGELIEWAGWAILTWSISGVVFWLWTFANLAPRAISHHRWYRNRFPNYPPHRKALIPYVL